MDTTVKNEVKFGYGDILITQNMNSITIRKLNDENKYNIGENIKISDANFSNAYNIYFREYSELMDFKQKINKAYEEHKFTFQNILFNFENYQRRSIDVILDKINWIERFMVSNTIC